MINVHRDPPNPVTDRTGQVWADSGFDGETILLVLGPPTVDDEGDLSHPSLVLSGGEYTGTQTGCKSGWYEYSDLPPWEEDFDMKRIG